MFTAHGCHTFLINISFRAALVMFVLYFFIFSVLCEMQLYDWNVFFPFSYHCEHNDKMLYFAKCNVCIQMVGLLFPLSHWVIQQVLIAVCVTFMNCSLICFSYCYSFRWLNPLFKTGYKRRLEEDDMYEVLQEDQSENLGQDLKR